MKYAYTIIYVKDVLETVQFYENAFGFALKFVTPEKDYAELNTGDVSLAFASIQLGEHNFSKGFQKQQKTKQPFGVELAFVTETIDLDFDIALKAGATEYEPISEKPWGQKVGYLLDNNGFLIEICTPIKTDEKH